MKGLTVLRLLICYISIACVFTNAVQAQGYCGTGADLTSMRNVAVTDDDQQEIAVYDRFGNKYYAADFDIPSSPTARANDKCIAGGLFELKFLDVTRNNNDGFNHPTLGAARRQVICDVFADIAVLINEGKPGNNDLVRIWINESGSAMGSALGVASSYYSDPAFQDEGIMYNQTWLAIVTGEDPIKHFNVLQYQFSLGAPHGYMRIDFTKPLNVTTSGPPVAGQYDLYSVALHEAFHLLGIASAMDGDGTSSIGYTNLFFKFDEYLTFGNNPLLDVYTDLNGQCQTVARTDSTLLEQGCNTVYYNGINTTNLEVYSPTNWATGSSLSHFKCDPTGGCSIDYNTPATTVPATAPFPICMTPCIDETWIKRRPSIEEAGILCDIGYSLSNTYGANSSNAYSYYSNYPNCANVCIAAGTMDVKDAQGVNYAMLSGESITIDNVLDNDVGDDLHLSCISIIGGGGSISNITDTSFTYTGGAGYYGYALLSYKPVCGASGIGNFTYVMIRVTAAPLPLCTPGQCNLICHGDFEYAVPSHMHLLDMFTNDNDDHNSPDMYEYNGSRTVQIYRGILTANSTSSGPNVACGGLNTYPLPVQPGNKFMGISGAISNQECLYFELSRPLDPNKKYNFSVDATANIGSSCFGRLDVYLSKGRPCPDSMGLTWADCSRFNPVMVGSVNVNSVNWVNYSIDNITPDSAYQFLVVAGAGTYFPSNSPNYYSYADNFSLIEANQTHLRLNASTNSLTPCRGDQFTINYQVCIDSGLVPNNTPIEIEVITPAEISLLTAMPIVIPANSLTSVGGCSAQIPLSFSVNSSASVGAVYNIDADIIVGNGCLSTNVVRDGFGTEVTIASVEVVLPSVTACDSVEVNGVWFYNSGAMTTQSAGPNCDTTFTTQVTVGKTVRYSTSRIMGCDSVYYKGTWYYADETIVRQVPGPICDTTYYTEVYVSPSTITNTIVACDSAEVDGVWYYNSQTLTKQLPGIYCDTNIVTELTINNSYFHDRSLSVCDGVEINGQWYSTSQTVEDRYSSAVSGCDSVVTTYLVVSSIEATTTVWDNVITGPPNAHTYQWIDCSSGLLMPNATESAIKLPATGTYALIVTQNNCVDTSECVTVTVLVGMGDDPLLGDVRVYPNPVNSLLTIELPTSADQYRFELYSLLGQQVLHADIDHTQQIDVSQLQKGMYLYQLSNSSGGANVGKLLIE